ncbi:hypothetical protein JCM8547_007064 [Rhodosporidiobolus lusitaniae]
MPSPPPSPSLSSSSPLPPPPPPPKPNKHKQKLSLEQKTKAGQSSKGIRGTSRKEIPPPSGAFALPPPKPEFYEEGGLRKVRPYMYAFESWAKERWQNRTLLDIYSEFRDRSEEYYKWAIETGVIVVNNRKSTADTVIRNGDLISNVLHRHEPPVVSGPIKILYDGRLPGNDGETLVVEKPGSMPVHPTGRYNFNTLLEILKWDYGLPLVHTSNRLDRLTSGVMICALTVEASKKLGAWFGGRRAAEGGVKKEYVARVRGRFPDGEIECSEPLLTIDRQIGVNVVHPEGRPSVTYFTRLSYHPPSDTSVVHCRPITGRSHQIRVHLQFLGHSIANDPIYQNSAAWGEEGGKGGVFGEERGGGEGERRERRERGELVMQAEKARGGEGKDEKKDDKEKEGDDLRDGCPPSTPSLSAGARRAILALREVRDKDDGFARERDAEGVERARRELVGGMNKMSIDAGAEGGKGGEGGEGEEEEVLEEEEGEEGQEGGFCTTCFTPLLPDPKPEQLFIWLHAMRYTTTEWDWKSELPYWAEEGYDVPLSSLLA